MTIFHRVVYNRVVKNKVLINKFIIATSGFVGLVALVLCAYFLMPFWVYKPAQASAIAVNKQENMLTVSKNDMKILQLTDLHINNALDMPLTFSIIKGLIYKSDPDMIVITGDVFSSGCTTKNVKQFISFMDKFKLPWAVVLGNHDDETPYSLAQLSSCLETAEYSLFKTGGLVDLYGNYFYNIKFANDNTFQFIFMDSRSDGFTQESVNYYQSVVQSSASVNNGAIINNWLFYHIPLAELNDAVEQYKLDSGIGAGELRESVKTQQNNVGFFDKVIELGATKAMMFGHDHLNNTRIKYQGIDFCYGVKTGTSAYEEHDMLGGVVYTLSSTGQYSAQNIFVFN